MAHKTKNIYYLQLYNNKKSLPTPGLEMDPVATFLDYEIKGNTPGTRIEKQTRKSWAL